MWSRAVVVLGLSVVLVLGCGAERGDKPTGEPCGDANECRHGLCVAGIAGDEPVCTHSCAAAADCPRGWACSGVTEENVLVCTRGASNPFGNGANQ